MVILKGFALQAVLQFYQSYTWRVVVVVVVVVESMRYILHIDDTLGVYGL